MPQQTDGQGPIFLSSTDFELPKNMPIGLEKYTNFSTMAKGGTAVLQTCFDTIAGRTVVMKTLLRQYLLDKQENRRLLREARITAQLQHPNTVPVYEIGNDLKRGIYFTMKRISGENFYDILKRAASSSGEASGYPLKRRIEVLTSAGLALMYAHTRGVIHRDVKPENIWVGNFGEVILLDWGVAKVWGQPDDVSVSHHDVERSQPQAITMTGDRPGTPLYMSPEQISGNRATVDERTDIFSMGVALYEATCFCEPFRGRVIQETFENILNKTPKRPSDVQTHENVPSELDDIIMKAIDKTPAHRFQTMRQMIDALRSIHYPE